MTLIDANYVLCEYHVIGAFSVIAWYNYYLEALSVLIMDLKVGSIIKYVSAGRPLAQVLYSSKE